MSELARRVLVSVVAAPLAVAVVYVGDWPLATLLSVVAALGAWELFRIARAGGVDPLGGLGIALAALVPIVVHAHVRGLRAAAFPATDILGRAFATTFTASWGGAALAFLVVFAATIWLRGVAGRPLPAAAITLFGAAYTGGMISFAYLIRYHDYAVGRPAGAALLALPMVLTWMSDIGAYFVGRSLGRHKLIPSVSPGKTVEGAVGGLVFTAVSAWLYVEFVLRPVGQLGMRPLAAVAFGALVSVAAQVGDLAESLLKREAGVKDSSRLIPGHGGVLDRLDSMFFVMPVAYLLLSALLVPAPR